MPTDFFKIGQALGGGGDPGLSSVNADIAAGASFGALIGKGITEEKERQRIADEKIAKEIDDNYGSLQIAPTGDESYDASLQNMSREWKEEFNMVVTDKNLSAAEKAIRRNEILARAKEVKAGSDALAQFANDFFEAEANGQISASTPANIKMLADALRNKEGVGIENVNGIPTLVGSTPDGEPISVPVSDIASGKNTFRFNTKFDSDGALNTIATDLEGKNLSPEQVAQRAEHEVNKILNNSSTIQAIAADELGIDAMQIRDIPQEELKMMVSDHLQAKLQQEYLPKNLTALQQQQLALQQQSGARAERQLQIAEEGLQIRKDQVEAVRDQAFIQQDARKASAQQTYDVVNQIYADPSAVTAEAVSTAFGVPTKVQGNNLAVIIGDKTHVITDFKTPAGRAQLNKLFGGSRVPGDIGIEYDEEGNPIRRRSVLKRFTTWLDSMVKN